MSNGIEIARPESLLHFAKRNRLNVVLQSEEAECGLACLVMIAGYYGYETDLTVIRQRLSVSSHGMDLQRMMEMASSMQFSTRPLKLDIEDIGELQLPCILHWELNHFVVLKSVQKNRVVIIDPARGERSVDAKELSRCFTGVALELIPTDKFVPHKEKKKLKIGQFWTRIVGLKESLITILLLSLLLEVFAIASPFYMQTVVDDVILRSDSNLLLVLALGFGLLMLIKTMTTVLREFVILSISSRLSIQMAANLFRHLIRLPMDYFSKRHMGDIVSRFGSIDSIRELLTTGLVSAIVDGLLAIVTLVVMFVYDPQLAVVVLMFVAVSAIIRFAFYRPLRLLTEEQIAADANKESYFMESIRAIQPIKLFEKEDYRQSQWQNRFAEAMNKGIRLQKWGIGFTTVNALLFGIENLVVVYLLAQAVMGNAMSVGMLYAFMSYKGRFVESMEKLIEQAIEIKMLSVHLGRLSDIVYTPIESSRDSGDQSLVAGDGEALLSGKIEVRGLSYAYSEADAPVFQNLSFTIEAGETVAITGPSGCGKSTLINCLMGLLKPTKGEILVDGKPLNHITNYRSQIAGVMQEDKLISGSVSDNIAFFDERPDMERIMQCAQIACIYDEIMMMPMQFNTLVGDLGTGLSGGQKQRIVLARAIYRQPRILFLDEATSHLDTFNESRVNEHIRNFNITRVLVAHRAETIRSADRHIDLLELYRKGHQMGDFQA